MNNDTMLKLYVRVAKPVIKLLWLMWPDQRVPFATDSVNLDAVSDDGLPNGTLTYANTPQWSCGYKLW